VAKPVHLLTQGDTAISNSLAKEEANFPADLFASANCRYPMREFFHDCNVRERLSSVSGLSFLLVRKEEMMKSDRETAGVLDPGMLIDNLWQTRVG
jgi:hypothetical protein